MRTGGGRGRSQTSSRPLFPLYGNGGGGDDVCACVCNWCTCVDSDKAGGRDTSVKVAWKWLCV